MFSVGCFVFCQVLSGNGGRELRHVVLVFLHTLPVALEAVFLTECEGDLFPPFEGFCEAVCVLFEMLEEEWCFAPVSDFFFDVLYLREL